MNVLPVITRELRAQARQPFTYLLRLYGVAALLAVTCFVTLREEFTADDGPELFLWLHRTMLAAIWFLIPLAAADCLSRERREGTLGLLFLTPLSARDIVLAKCAAHGLRALTLWLTSLPVLVLPFLLGGIGWEMVLPSCAINFISIVLVVGFSVLASSLCRRAQRALALTATFGATLLAALAYFLSVAIGLVYLIACTLLTVGSGQATLQGDDWWKDWWELIVSPMEGVQAFSYLVVGASGVWQEILSRSSLSVRESALISFATGILLVLLMSFGFMRLAARILRRHWREPARSVRAERLEKRFLRPVVGVGLLRSWLRRSLERNPIGWLEQRTWSGRLAVWGWLAVMVSVYSFVFGSGLGRFMYDFDGLQVTLSALLLFSLAAAAAGSFLRERETGVLELLVVSPLSEWQIITGRLRGLWLQFLPSVGLLAFVWFFAAGFFADVNPLSVVWVASSFVTLPMIGLDSSLRFPGYVGAVIATLTFGQATPALAVLLPQLLRGLELLMGWRGLPRWPDAQPAGMIIGIAVQCLLALWLVMSLHANLAQRRFAQERRTA